MSSIVSTGSDSVKELTKALGIGKNVLSFTLVVKPDNILRLHVAYAVTEEQVLGMTEVFKKYTLEER